MTNSKNVIRKKLLVAALGLLIALSYAGAAKSGGMSVLIIGDSNTEFGRIANGISDTLQRYYGVSGTGYGYIPMFSTFLALRDKIYTGVSVSYDSNWKLYDMFEGSRLKTLPYLSPNGHWLISSTVNSTATITFSGTSIDMYWLGQTNGGTFTIAIDNVVKDTIKTNGAREVNKSPVAGLTNGNHTCTIKLVSGSVTLLGFDGHKNAEGKPRSVVHNWGNGYAATIDFVNIDSTIFVTGLQKLAPDVVVLLLGTNDYLQDRRKAADVKTNLKIIINRIKAAKVTDKILEVSTFMTNNSGDATYVNDYRANAWPQAASETGILYWDMSTWFGPWTSANMGNDNNHCNDAGGKKIGIEMLHQILTKFPQTGIGEKSDFMLKEKLSNVKLSGNKLTINKERNTVVTIEITQVNGACIKKINAASQDQFLFGEGLLSVPCSGVYILKVTAGNGKYSWIVPKVNVN